MMKLHDKLVLLRKEKGLSQLDMAERLNISRQAISRWETGVGIPSMESLISISELYGITLDELINDSAYCPGIKMTDSNESGKDPIVNHRSNKNKKAIVVVTMLLIMIFVGYVTVKHLNREKGEKIISIGEMQSRQEDNTLGETFDVGW